MCSGQLRNTLGVFSGSRGVTNGLMPNRNRVYRDRFNTSNESQHPIMTKIQVATTATIPSSPMDFEKERKANVSGM